LQTETLEEIKGFLGEEVVMLLKVQLRQLYLFTKLMSLENAVETTAVFMRDFTERYDINLEDLRVVTHELTEEINGLDWDLSFEKRGDLYYFDGTSYPPKEDGP
jgi:hypothetical protein